MFSGSSILYGMPTTPGNFRKGKKEDTFQVRKMAQMAPFQAILSTLLQLGQFR